MKLAKWDEFPLPVRIHLEERLKDRRIDSSIHVPALARWIKSEPDVPEGQWYKRFGDFTICGQGRFPKTFLLSHHHPHGQEL